MAHCLHLKMTICQNVEVEKLTIHATLVRENIGVLKKLKSEGVYLIALENKKRKSKDYRQLKISWPAALIVGDEVQGLPPKILDLADEVIALPMLGVKESLNVSVACGVALYHLNSLRPKHSRQ